MLEVFAGSQASASVSLDPGALQVAVDEGADRLEAAADALYKATVKAGQAELVFEKARLVALATLHREAESGKLPAQDIRQALIFPRLSSEWDDYYVAKYELEAVEKRYRALAAAVSARQSLLKARGG